MPTTDELFGVDSDGDSLVSLETPPDAPRRDIVLPVCYRNSPWALATAHALGMGTYRDPGGLVQHPDEPRLWEDIGYEAVHGTLALGRNVTLARRRDASPGYFSRLLTPADAVRYRAFENERDQDVWVAKQIKENLEVDELEPDDILIVLPDTYRAKSRGPRLMNELRRLDVPSHLVGVTTTQDSIFMRDSVAIAHIYRAKGNEAPMVYVVDSQYANHPSSLISRRNILFTAITRSRAWVRIVGWGERAESVTQEAAAVASNDYRLSFKIPSAGELRELRHIYRDRSEQDEENLRKATEGLTTFLELLSRGEIELDDLPPAIRTQLAQSVKRRRLQSENGDDD